MQLNDQLKLVKYKLDNINELHNRLADQGRLSTIEMDLLLRNMMEVYEFYHILKMEKVLWQQTDPSIYQHKDDLSEVEDDQENTFPENEEEKGMPEIESEDAPTSEDLVEVEKGMPSVQAPEVEEVKLTERITMSTVSLFNDTIESPFKTEIESKIPNEGDSAEEETPSSAETEEPNVSWEMGIEEEQILVKAEPTLSLMFPEKDNTDQLINDNEPEVTVVTFKPESVINRPANKPALPIEANIAINDKFVYIRELFGGDFEAYEQTISEINNLQSKSEALNYLSRNVADKFDWLEKEDIANEFYALLQKHFDF